jgi:hypothetical protein
MEVDMKGIITVKDGKFKSDNTGRWVGTKTMRTIEMVNGRATICFHRHKRLEINIDNYKESPFWVKEYILKDGEYDLEKMKIKWLRPDEPENKPFYYENKNIQHLLDGYCFPHESVARYNLRSSR